MRGFSPRGPHCQGSHVPEQGGTLTGVGGVSLRYWVQAAQAARGTCVLVHGVGEHSGRYRHVAQALNQRCRLTVAALDYRGHGRSGGQRGHCGTFEELLSDVDLMITQVRKDQPAEKLFLLGHSLGGLIALTYALRNRSKISAVIASSPALELYAPPPVLKRFLARALGGIFPSMSVKNGVDPAILSHDPATVKEYRTDPLVHPYVTFGSYLSTLRAMGWARSHAQEMSIPCLILQAGDDRLVSRPASETFARQVTSVGSTYQVYERFYHEIFNEVDREKVLSDLCQWINARFN